MDKSRNEYKIRDVPNFWPSARSTVNGRSFCPLDPPNRRGFRFPAICQRRGCVALHRPFAGDGLYPPRTARTGAPLQRGIRTHRPAALPRMIGHHQFRQDRHAGQIGAPAGTCNGVRQLITVNGTLTISKSGVVLGDIVVNSGATFNGNGQNLTFSGNVTNAGGVESGRATAATQTYSGSKTLVRDHQQRHRELHRDVSKSWPLRHWHQLRQSRHVRSGRADKCQRAAIGNQHDSNHHSRWSPPTSATPSRIGAAILPRSNRSATTTSR